MSRTVFDLLAMGMRYWFAALAVYILFRVVVSVSREFSRERDESRYATGSYAMGILEVVAPQDNRKIYGARFPLRQENKIGRSSSCDIRIKDRSLAPVQALISQRGRQVVLSDYGSRKGVRLNGQRLTGDIALLDGDEIRLSDVVLLLHIEGGTRRQAPAQTASQGDAIAYDDPDAWDRADVYDPDEEDVYDGEDDYGFETEDDEDSDDGYDPAEEDESEDGASWRRDREEGWWR